MSNHNRILFLFSAFLLFSTSAVKGQSCKEYEIYQVAFEDLALNYKDTLVIDIRNDRVPLLINDIKKVSNLSEAQLEHVVEIVSRDWDWTQCPKIQDLLQDVRSNSPSPIGETYYKITCSQPIFVSETKALLIFSFSTNDHNNEEGKAIGADALDIYVLDDLKWKRVDRKALSL